MSLRAASRRKGSIVKRAGLTFVLALGALAVVPAIASAGNVATATTVITYTGDGSADTVTVTDSGVDSYTIAETGISSSSASCIDGGDTVTCTGTAWTSVVANLGNGDDVFTAAGVNDDPFTIDGGNGNDGNVTGSSADDIINGGLDSDNSTATGLSGGPGNDTINGGTGGGIGDIINGDAGNDLLYGGLDGADDLNGGAGNDRMEGGDNSDDFDGGADLDRVTYGLGGGVLSNACIAGDPVAITMDNVANDGGCNAETVENVQSSVESITGSTSDGDTYTGSCCPNTFAGSIGTTSATTDGGDTDHR